ncbi:unnamed protein product [Pleuronectes platessa]|uniref:Uncharacterized protein n=1 Tax=Pleuronectes platessa TaxID=8262 RepID=A0A9N7UTN4_PLEPL|nr:unnamed protein product [Pleuronectes platessa]
MSLHVFKPFRSVLSDNRLLPDFFAPLKEKGKPPGATPCSPSSATKCKLRHPSPSAAGRAVGCGREKRKHLRDFLPFRAAPESPLLLSTSSELFKTGIMERASDGAVTGPTLHPPPGVGVWETGAELHTGWLWYFYLTAWSHVPECKAKFTRAEPRAKINCSSKRVTCSLICGARPFPSR